MPAMLLLAAALLSGAEAADGGALKLCILVSWVRRRQSVGGHNVRARTRRARALSLSRSQ